MNYNATYGIRQGTDERIQRIQEDILATTDQSALEAAIKMGQEFSKDKPLERADAFRQVTLLSLTNNEGHELEQYIPFSTTYIHMVSGKAVMTYAYIDQICEGLEPWELPQTD